MVRRFGAGSLPTRFAISLMNKFHHLFQRGPREKDFVHAFAFHNRRIVMRDSATAATEYLYVVRAFFSQKTRNSRKKLDVAAVVT